MLCNLSIFVLFNNVINGNWNGDIKTVVTVNLQNFYVHYKYKWSVTEVPIWWFVEQALIAKNAGDRLWAFSSWQKLVQLWYFGWRIYFNGFIVNINYNIIKHLNNLMIFNIISSQTLDFFVLLCYTKCSLFPKNCKVSFLKIDW